MRVKNRHQSKTTTSLLLCCLVVLFLAAPGPTPRRATSRLPADDGTHSVAGVLSTDSPLAAATKASAPFVGVKA